MEGLIHFLLAMSGIKMSQQKEKVSVPMVTLSVPQETYAPGYSASYTPEAYTSQSYNPQMYAPQPYSSEPQMYKQYTSDPYAPNMLALTKFHLHLLCMDSSPPVVVAGIFSSKPASTICPCCRQIITTEVVFRVGCCLGCCLIPFMSKCCKDVDHYCPCCRYHIYRYKRI
ncbi:hypothetical protein E2320_011971 [Naja naja]|nr:hypothetical protein E2320_011971 [Naja naja]